MTPHRDNSISVINSKFANSSVVLSFSDHCLDYLRQVIMCHGDLTPITFEWNDELSTYLAHHSTQHECRNFEKIFSWSKQRKEMDMEVDGNHQNVELVKPEIFD